MKKKSIAVIAIASCMALSAPFAGCSLVAVNNRADMAQVIATIDITKSEKFEANGFTSDYANAISERDIIKRDLVSYFLNVGYSYVQNNYSYNDTFTMLMDALVNNAIYTQYATATLLKYGVEGGEITISEYNSKSTLEEKYVYLLGGENSDDVKLAKYNLYSSLNSAIDNYEKRIVDEDDGYTGTDTRTTPVNLDSEQDNYYPHTADGSLDYNVYTGFAGYTLAESGIYKEDALEGTTTASRKRAYNNFLNNLSRNYLITSEEADKFTDILELDYIHNEYVSQLETRIVNKYYDEYEKRQAQSLVEGNYIQNVYEGLLEDQTDAYSTASAFETAMSSMSSTSFILYSPETNDAEFSHDGNYGVNYGRFGFVYNILLPFSGKQRVKLAELNAIKALDGDEEDYYYQRNQLLKEIETEDQRQAWFNGAENYSFNALESGFERSEYYGVSDYLFFENNLTDSGEGGRYKPLQAYNGKYSYNGNVYENEDGSYTLIGNKLNIDDMLDEFTAYINFVLGGDNNVNTFYTANYYDNKSFKDVNDYDKDGDTDEIDYSKFLYAYGNVDLGGNFSKTDLFNANAQSKQYKAMSAVNELQFAYTTDTGVLSQYVGYSVSAYDTNYIKEFEYASKLAISNGPGSFAVCAGDYGWHLIYVTYVFDAGDTYTPNWDNIEVEGTFENMFYEWLKTNNLSDVTTLKNSKILSEFNKEDVTVTRYQSRYQDLLDLEA